MDYAHGNLHVQVLWFRLHGLCVEICCRCGFGAELHDGAVCVFSVGWKRAAERRGRTNDQQVLLWSWGWMEALTACMCVRAWMNAQINGVGVYLHMCEQFSVNPQSPCCNQPLVCVSPHFSICIIFCIHSFHLIPLLLYFHPSIPQWYFLFAPLMSYYPGWLVMFQ